MRTVTAGRIALAAAVASVSACALGTNVGPRIDLTISATSPLKPDVDVDLVVEGVARGQIDSGEVVLTLPTRALLDHVGHGPPQLPVKARWVLPPMAAGDTWSGTYTVPGEPAGTYRVMVNAYTHGPDGGLYFFDDVLRDAWMYIHATDGRLLSWEDM